MARTEANSLSHLARGSLYITYTLCLLLLSCMYLDQEVQAVLFTLPIIHCVHYIVLLVLRLEGPYLPMM